LEDLKKEPDSPIKNQELDKITKRKRQLEDFLSEIRSKGSPNEVLQLMEARSNELYSHLGKELREYQDMFLKQAEQRSGPRASSDQLEVPAFIVPRSFKATENLAEDLIELRKILPEVQKSLADRPFPGPRPRLDRQG